LVDFSPTLLKPVSHHANSFQLLS